MTDDGIDDTTSGALDDIGYSDALDELDEILHELERSDVDVDVLADRVARAARLIGVCRDRIGSARAKIDRVVADLDAATDPLVGSGDGSDAGDDPQ